MKFKKILEYKKESKLSKFRLVGKKTDYDSEPTVLEYFNDEKTAIKSKEKYNKKYKFLVIDKKQENNEWESNSLF